MLQLCSIKIYSIKVFILTLCCCFFLRRLKTLPRPKFSVCVLGDQQHCDEAKAAEIPHMDIEALKKLNKNKKLVKKLGNKFICEANEISAKEKTRHLQLNVFFLFLQPRSMMPSWPQSLWSSRSLVSWALVWTRLASSPPCSPTTRTWTQRWMKSNPQSSSRWKRLV